MRGKSGRRGAAMTEKERSEQGREELEEAFVTFRRIRKEAAEIQDHPIKKNDSKKVDLAMFLTQDVPKLLY